jgi:hypothetical protein
MERGMHRLLFHAGVRLLDFKRYALATSESVREASLREALEHRLRRFVLMVSRSIGDRSLTAGA